MLSGFALWCWGWSQGCIPSPTAEFLTGNTPTQALNLCPELPQLPVLPRNNDSELPKPVVSPHFQGLPSSSPLQSGLCSALLAALHSGAGMLHSCPRAHPPPPCPFRGSWLRLTGLSGSGQKPRSQTPIPTDSGAVVPKHQPFADHPCNLLYHYHK